MSTAYLILYTPHSPPPKCSSGCGGCIKRGTYQIPAAEGFKMQAPPPPLKHAFWPRQGGGGTYKFSLDYKVTRTPKISSNLVLQIPNRGVSNAAFAYAALVLGSKKSRWGSASKNKSKKTWASIFTLSPCGNGRCRCSESAIFISQVHPQSKINETRQKNKSKH